MTIIPADSLPNRNDRPIRILVLETRMSNADHIRRSFQQAASLFSITFAKSLREARKYLETSGYDLIFADGVLPDGRGIDILPRKDGLVTTPLIIMASNGDERLAVEMLKSGAIDYVIKTETVFRELPLITARALREWDTIQQRKHADEARRMSEAKYRLLHESIRDALVAVDMTGAITEVNQSFRDMIGYTGEELLGMNYRSITPERWQPVDERIVSGQVIPCGFSEIYEKEYRKKDGTVFPVELRVFLVRDADGKPSGMWAIVRDITGRRQAEQEIIEREEKYRNLFTAESDAVFLIDRDSGAILDVNEAACRLYGFSRDEMLRMRYTDVSAEPDLTAQSVEENQTSILCRHHRKRDGTVFPVEISVSNFTLKTKKIVLGTVRDVTGRRLMEQQLVGERETAKNLLEIAGSIILALDPDGIVTLVNRKGCEILGYSREEIVGKNWIDVFIPEKNRADLRSAFHDLVSDNPVSTVRLENPVLTRSGEEKIILWNNTVIRDSGGRVTGTLSSGEDITEPRMAEAALRSSEESYRGLFNTVRQAIFIHDTDGRIIDVNDGALSMFGYSRGEFIGRIPDFLPAPGDRDFNAVREKIRCAFSGIPQQFELLAQRKDGATFPNDIRLYKGRYFGKDVLIAIVTDITEQKQVEAELKKRQIQLAAAMDLSQLVNWEFDAGTGLFTFDDRFYALYGTTAENEGGHAMHAGVYAREFVHPDDQGRVAEEIRKALATTDPDYVGQMEHRIIRRDGQIRTITARYTVIMGPDGRVRGTYGANQDITDRKLAEDELRRKHDELNKTYEQLAAAEEDLRDNYRELEKSQQEAKASAEKYRNLFENMHEGFAYCRMLYDDSGRPEDFVYLNVNQAFERIAGVNRVVDKRVTEVFPGIREAFPQIFEIYGRVALTGIPESFDLDFKPAGKWLHLSVHSPEKGYFVAVFEDITQHKYDEDTLLLSNQMLQLSHQHLNLQPLLERFVGLIRTYTGCDSVGLRLLDAEGNIPYLAYSGFTRDFYERESPLSIANDQCMCINVIRGTTDPALPFYTRAGSFYMNGTTRFLATVSDEEKGKTRNVCNQFGYESVALIPIGMHDRILGLIHIADHRDDMVPLGLVRVLENVATSVGEAVRRVQVEEALQESEEKYRSLIENVVDVVYRTNREGTVTFASRSALSLLGYRDIQELINRPIESFWLNPADRAQMMERMSRDGFVRDFEVVILGAGQRQIPVSVSSSYYRDSTGAIAGVEGVIRDISERKRFERAIQESEVKFRSIFNNSSDMQFLVEITSSGMPGRILDANNIAVQALGYSKEELLGRNILDINILGTGEKAPRIMVEVFSKGHTTFESAYIRKDGSTMPVEVGVHTVEIGGKLVGISSARNITERKRQDQALQLSNQKLQLMNIVAWHDIQNKVTGLRGYVALSRDLVADEEVKSFIGKEEDILKLIHQQIQYTKEYQEIGAQPPQWVRLPGILNRVAAFERATVSITIDLPELELFCDPVIEKVFSHLIRNSVTQAPPATRVRISCNEEGGALHILYEDDGPGIPGDQKEQIFIRDVGKSGGFDLFFVHDILQLADMKIRETGEPGKGVRFEITVPAGNFRFSGK